MNEWLIRRNLISRHRKPRVLLNLVRLLPDGGGAGGAGRLVIGLLDHLSEHVELRVALAPRSTSLQSKYPDLTFIVVHEDSNLFLKDQLAWCDCYIDPLNGLRPTAIDADVAVIGLILDLQHMRMPWLFSESEMAARIAEYGYAIARSDQLVAISEYERQNLIHYYGVDRISVMHLAGFMAEESTRLADPKGDEPVDGRFKDGYLIFPAVPWLHKNHEILIQAIGLLRRRGIEIPLILTNTGARPETRKTLEAVVEAYGLSDVVEFESFLAEPELFKLFVGSSGMVFPTLYEGFGIPLVDAMALGVPILTTNTSAVPEICGNAVSYFSNATNVVAMANDLSAFWLNPTLRRAKLDQASRRAKRFTSEKMATSLLDAIRMAIARKDEGERKLPPNSHAIPARLTTHSVLITYSDLSDADRAWLCRLDDVHAWHLSRFGSEADVTVALDVEATQDFALAQAFATVPKLILLSGNHSSAIDHAVSDFSQRYDSSEFQMIVQFNENRFDQYDPDALGLALLALRLHRDADFAIFDDKIVDCVLDQLPSAVAGVLHYDRRRQSGVAVFDAILRRSSASGLKNGSAEYLSKFCTKFRCLRVPCS